MRMTKAASRNEESKGARKVPKIRKTLTSREESKRRGPATSTRMHAAPIRASLELLTNQPSTIAAGTPLCSSAARCAGNAARRSSHHDRAGVSSSAASSSEFGGQSVETGCGWEGNGETVPGPAQHTDCDTD